MKRRSGIPLFTTLLLLTFVFVLMIAVQAASPATIAQTPTFYPTYNATEQAQIDAEWQRIYDGSLTLDADLRSRNIVDYPTAYLVSEDAAANDKTFSEAKITALTSAQVFYNWDDFAASHTAQSFEILLVHESMADAVDREWAYQAFRDEVMIMGFNISLGRLAKMVGITCFKDKPLPDSIPPEWNWLYMIGYGVRVADPENYETYKQALIEDCEQHGNDGRNHTYYKTISYPLVEPEHVDTLPNILTAHTYTYGKPNRSLNK